MTRPTFVQNVEKGLPDWLINFYCPAVFAEEPYADCSASYEFISTKEALTQLREAGFVVTSAMQSRAKEDRFGYTLHMLRLRKFEDLGCSKPEVPEVIWRNSSDRKSPVQLWFGYCRSACLNGQVVGDAILKGLKVRHYGSAAQNAVGNALELINQAPRVLDIIQDMKNYHLDLDEQRAFAQHILQARFRVRGQQTADSIPYTADNFLVRVRPEDRGDDVHTVMNVTQEWAIRGNATSNDREHVSKPITSVEKNIKLNQKVWDAAMVAWQYKKAGKQLTLEALTKK